MLNKQQQQAVEEINNPLLVVAGPGTGKTTVITQKILLLLNEHFNPEEILALTFTQKAAEEMSERVKKEAEKEFLAKTFHSFALDLIDEFQGEISEIDQDYLLLDEGSQLLFFNEHINSFKLKSFEVKNNQKYVAYELFSTVMKLKEYGVTQENIDEFDFPQSTQKEDIVNVFNAYENFKKENNFIDFGDILLLLINLIKKDKNIEKELKSRYKYILVDEFQDTNKIQFELLELLSTGKNITLVGDAKQSIYSFRGANIKNFDLFKENFSHIKEIYLQENYRSSRNVIKAFNNVALRIGGEKEILHSQSKEEGNVELIKCQTQDSQLTFILEKIREELKKNPEATIGILSRKNFELSEISQYLKRFDIDHFVSKQESFQDYELIKEILYVLDIANKPYESNVELFSLLNSLPLRKETVRKISRLSSLREKSLYRVLTTMEKFSDYEAEQEIIVKFTQRLKKIVEISSSKIQIRDLVFNIIDEFEFYKKALLSKSENNVFALNGFIKFVESYSQMYKTKGLEHFINIAKLSKGTYADELQLEKSQVQLLSIHQAKGKEFDVVLMPNLNDKRMPSMYKNPKLQTPFDQKREDFIDEEERLFFVALSRAKKDLFLSYVKRFDNNKTDSKPSIFVNYLYLQEKEYNVEQRGVAINKTDKIKLSTLRKIRDLVFHDQYDEAEGQLRALKKVFSSKRDLRDYFSQDTIQELEVDEEDTVEFNLRSLVYSSTQIKMYQTCPKKYLYSYIYKIPTPSQHYFDFGTSMHTTLEYLVNLMNSELKGDVLYTKAMSKLSEIWISKAYKNAQQEKEYLQKAQEIIKQFLKTQRNLQKKQEVQDIERDFSIEIDSRRFIGFIDRVDRLDRGYEILDYKTSQYMEPMTKMKENIQLNLYALAAKKLYGSYPKKVSLWYLLHNKIVSISVDENQIEKTKSEILSTVKDIEKRDFRATPSQFACKFCEFNSMCPYSKFK